MRDIFYGKKNHVTGAFLLSAALVWMSCVSGEIITAARARENLLNLSEGLSGNRMRMLQVSKKKVGSSGFYYVVDSSGRILAHPKAMLVGGYFRRNRFINRVIRERSGCYYYSLGRDRFVIFFEPVNKREILCLSIRGDEIKGYTRMCSAAEP